MRQFRGDIPVGTVFGRWIVRSEKIQYGQKYKYLCECTCVLKTQREVEKGNLQSGLSTNCGCVRSEKVSTRNFKHGLSEHPLYQVWYDMVRRCTDPDHPSYLNYVDKGVCKQWLRSPEKFIKWGETQNYAVGLQLDRKKNHLGYSPSNCRFVTPSRNSRNRSNNVVIDRGAYKGRLLIDIWEVFGKKVSFDLALARYHKGKDPLEACTKPSLHRRYASEDQLVW